MGNLRDELCDFLVRLGLTIESRERDGVVASRRTALTQERVHYVVRERGGGRTDPDHTLILPSGTPAPRRQGKGPWYYFEDFLDRTIQSDRIARETSELAFDPDVRAQLEVFVPQHIAEAGNRQEEDSVRFFFGQWLEEARSRLLVVLAPAGYGKTLLTYHLARRLADAHLASRAAPRRPTPFLIPFAKFRRVAEFEGMILSSLQRRAITDFTAAAFAYLVARGRVVLFLDGFDELLEERPVEAQKNLREFIETLRGQGKVLITARSTFFRTSLDVADFLEHDLSADDVTVIDLLPFSAEQRAHVIARLSPDQRTITRVKSVVESEGIREAMGSPLLLRETVEALIHGDAAVGRNPARGELFAALETSVYERERRRQGHRFLDEVQRSFLRDIAWESLRENQRTFEMDLVRVAAATAAGDLVVSDGELEKLADHHFLTTDPHSQDVRFNHQVFREYFQALALLSLLHEGDAQSVAQVLSRRPMPEEVQVFFTELASPESIAALIESVKGDWVSDTLVNNVGNICATSGERDWVLAFLNTVPKTTRLGVRFRDLDLSEADFAGRLLAGTEFFGGSLANSDFRGAILQEAAFHECDLTGARFGDAEAHVAVFDHKIRLFGTAPILEALSQRGADCGPEGEEAAEDLAAQWQEWVQGVVRGRLWRFYRPGTGGPEGSTWDVSIEEKNALGGLDQYERRFVATKVLPEMVGLAILVRDREHGDVVYRLQDRAKDDARALIERGEIVGLVAQLIERLSK